ncbi:NADH dehydrogenase [Flavimobilis marinus]|uniref:Pyridine nucleotide-disulphide oxidoreductase n=1 Tax=Flavimobilis marinus TaxID=285351 RepID=A0A1I2HDF0_9MICO|nr:FAD-dependent oxidoreductase [Flavimobilis marinus]GHG57784.1 NADH dehydrogenase [Flavimobilis marinus]SFF28265.1 Pyridine nucleotide-disulphide oxidoreductase [Flavimobilis marinus]
MTDRARPTRGNPGGSQTVLVLGAGYAGIMTANGVRAALRPDEAASVRVVLVAPGAQFVERVRLHQLIAGSVGGVTRALDDLLHPEVEVVDGYATRIDPDAREVEVDRSTVLGYSVLVYAVGSGARPAAVDPHARVVACAEDSALARQDLAGLAPGRAVVVVGAGMTGVETASEVAQARPDLQVTLVSAGVLLPGSPARARGRVERTIRELGVALRTSATVVAVGRDAVTLADGTVVPAHLCLWAGPLTTPELAASSGLPVDGRGRLLVDGALRTLGHPDIVGAGDAVSLPDVVGGHLRPSCASALALGRRAQDTVLALVRHEPVVARPVGYLVQCLSLGRAGGYVQLVKPDDTPLPLALHGRPAALVKEQITRMAVAAVERERRRPGSYVVPPGPRPQRARAGA